VSFHELSFHELSFHEIPSYQFFAFSRIWTAKTNKIIIMSANKSCVLRSVFFKHWAHRSSSLFICLICLYEKWHCPYIPSQTISTSAKSFSPRSSHYCDAVLVL
jgi:hypothetical protein